MALLNKHTVDVLFKPCPVETGEGGVEMVIYTDIDPPPTNDEGKRVLAEFMREVDVHTREHPEIRRIEIIKDR